MSTTYVDAAYCYRPSSVVCRSVGRSLTLVSLAKTAEPIDLPFFIDLMKHKFNSTRPVAPMCPHVRAHWLFLNYTNVVHARMTLNSNDKQISSNRSSHQMHNAEQEF